MQRDELEGLTISAAAALLGVPAPTIRSWERRYGIAEPDRTTGAHRRYDVRALAELRDFRDAVAAGRRPKEAAEVVKQRAAQRDQNPAVIQRIIQAGHNFDPEPIRSALDQTVRNLGLFRTIDLVVLPVMREIGVLWESGKCDVANEHLASHAVRTWLSGQLQLARPSRGKPVVVLACGPKDLHTIGLEALFVLLARRSWNCRLLGAMTPTSSVVAAARASRAHAAIISSHMTTARKEAIKSIAALEAAGVAAFYGGNAFVTERSRVGVPGTYLGEDLTGAVQILEQMLMP